MNYSQNQYYKNTSKVQQIIERNGLDKYRKPSLYKNKKYIRQVCNKQIIPVKPSVIKRLLPSPKYLKMEQEIEEKVQEEQDFEQLMTECEEIRFLELIEDEYEYIHDSCVRLLCPL